MMGRTLRVWLSTLFTFIGLHFWKYLASSLFSPHQLLGYASNLIPSFSVANSQKASKGKKTEYFYTVPEFKTWMEAQGTRHTWDIKYLKVCISNSVLGIGANSQ